MTRFLKSFNPGILIAKSILLLVLASWAIEAPGQNKIVTAGEVVERIKSNLTCPWQDKTVDTFKAGNDEFRVTGIATTFLANLEVLKKAKANGLNMVITHEPTFYNHFDEKSRYGDDPVLAAKLRFIEENDMVVWRFHDHWHMTEPDGIYKGITDQLEWSVYQVADNRFAIPTTKLRDLARHLKEVFRAQAIRVIGNPEMMVSKTALVLGAPGSMAQIEALSRSDVHVLIGGESPEWETVEYVRDAISAGMDKAIIFLGHALSEEAGMEYCARWLNEFITEIPVQFIPAGEPFWIPE